MSTKRDQIIDTTCQLMEVQGYHATGLNQILAESGAPKGSLYYYFPAGKEELTIEAVARSARAIEQRISLVMADSDDPITAVPTFITLLAQQVAASNFSAGGPITAIAVESASTNERLREACRQAYQSWQDVFAEKLRQGGFSAARSRRLSAVIIAALEGGIILSRSQQSIQPLLDVAEEVELLLRGGP
ncbi:MAG: TetR/AcrR family transcriptional regulator [Chloroflexi bacterium]|nr:TetR/AcrR family transcriptional regulator [Ardenticatenaceae bacterium]MBL1130620.1 TetR/AcrR family transcriptional regulator [Chloroflexota bacterium]NOG36713.1 TetR/AcrR family transcriptional regulator [Chloroflexota bacterium]GIK56776.1 MAG: putative HTH-type transcriptional regulator YxaF [Chloroflexota bacterium]